MLKRLYARIAHWDVEFFCADDPAAYAKSLPQDKRVIADLLV